MIREREYDHFCPHAEALRLEDEGLPPKRGKSMAYELVASVHGAPSHNQN
jgi:hypothetical protein